MSVITENIDYSVPFVIPADCIPVKGVSRSTICDLTRNRFIYIPNALYEIIYRFEGKLSINEIKSHFDTNEAAIIDEYFHFLFQNEMIFFTESPQNFPKISIENWSDPNSILQCIVDFRDGYDYIKDKIHFKEDINTIGCRWVQLRFFGKNEITFIYKIINLFESSSVEGIEVIVEFSGKLNLISYRLMAAKFQRINYILISGMGVERPPLLKSQGSNVDIYFTSQIISNEFQCGAINFKNFSINIQTFGESQNYNSCLNRKISIDTRGEIKNCPSMKEGYGNIAETTLYQAINKTGFKKYWTINKDKIDVCKMCEFRHICTDCRAYIERPDDLYSKPLKCGYDPITMEWENWKLNPIKQDIFAQYGGSIGPL